MNHDRVTCRYNREAEDYLRPDGQPCRTDDYGDPTRHCTARRTCSQHVGAGELTCARCMGRTRMDLRAIPDLAALMPDEAEEIGTVESEALNLAGPATDPRTWAERRTAMRSHLTAWSIRGKITDRQYEHARLTMEDDDEQHPYNVLTRWQMMLSEDYDHDLPVHLTTHDAAGYLDRMLGRIAQDPDQDFPLFAREIRKCRSHLESVLRDGQDREVGAPCPECVDAGNGVVKLVREYGHWCTDPECARFHYSVMLDGMTGEVKPDTSGDVWVCPRNRDEHRWTHEAYEKWIEERRAYNRDAS